MGSCFLVRRAAADQVGLFDEDFFLFSEETDWCYRFHEAGWTVWFTPGAEAVHVGKTQAVCRCEVFAVGATGEKLCALAQGTIVAAPGQTEP